MFFPILFIDWSLVSLVAMKFFLQILFPNERENVQVLIAKAVIICLLH